MSRRLISIVLPAYQEHKHVALIYRHFVNEVLPLIHKDYDYEMIWVNDGSRDGGKTRAEIMILASQDPHVKGINLSRNFGKEIAMTAGIQASTGDAVITLDADGQHPIQKIPDFIQAWQDGYPIVYHKRPYTQGISWLKRRSSSLFYRLFNAVSSFQLEAHATDYRLLDRKVVNIFLQFKEKNRMYRGLTDLLGFDRKAIVFDALPNTQGRKTSYTYHKLFKLALDSVTSFSVWPLKCVAVLGTIIVCASFLGILLILCHIYFWDNIWGFSNLGFFTLINTFFIGMMMMSLGLIAIYIANIHEEVQDRPLYIIKDQINIHHEQNVKTHTL